MLPLILTPVTNDCFTIGAMNLGTRIKQAIELAGTNPPDLARASGVPVASINALIRRDSRRSEFTEQLVAVLPADKVNLDWVRTGHGKPQPPVQLQLVKDAAGHQGKGTTEPFDKRVGDSPIRSWEHPTELPPGDWVFIPRLRVQTVGEGAELKVETVLAKAEVQAFLADWIRDDQLKPSGLAYSIATDASMATVIYEDDKYVVDTNQKDVIDGRTFAIHYGDSERVRKLFRLPGGGLRIETNNKDYPSLDLTAEQAKGVAVLGRVVHRAGSGGL